MFTQTLRARGAARLSVICASALLPLAALSAPATDPRAPAATVESWLSQEGLALFGPTAEGDLNGDGRSDWAGVVIPESGTSGGTPRMWVAVLLADATGGYRWSVSSRAVQESGMGCCWPEQLEIRKGSLFVSHAAKDAHQHQLATHQFRKQPQGWRLIGRTLRKADARTESLIEQDWNVLTGQVTQKSSHGERPPRTQRSRLAARPSFLNDYDFDHHFGEAPGPR